MAETNEEFVAGLRRIVNENVFIVANSLSYSASDICKAFAEACDRLEGAEEKIEQLEKENKRLSERDCNASVQLCFDDGINPFAKEDLKVVDVGVSDNTYVVESQTVSVLKANIEQQQKCIRELIKTAKAFRELTKIDTPAHDRLIAKAEEMLK